MVFMPIKKVPTGALSEILDLFIVVSDWVCIPGSGGEFVLCKVLLLELNV